MLCGTNAPPKWWFYKFLQIGQKSLFECYLGNAPSPCRTKCFPLYFSILHLGPNIFLFLFILLPRLSHFLQEPPPPFCVFLLWDIFLLFFLLYNALSLRAGGVGGWSQFGDTMQNMHNAAKLGWSHWKLWKTITFLGKDKTLSKCYWPFFVSSITTSGPCEVSREIEKCFGHSPYLGGRGAGGGGFFSHLAGGPFHEPCVTQLM